MSSVSLRQTCLSVPHFNDLQQVTHEACLLTKRTATSPKLGAGKQSLLEDRSNVDVGGQVVNGVLFNPSEMGAVLGHEAGA